ncbi:unnamed protein product [Vitrella brassicaformis CCMP3155]|uniref:PITH domain-containing protein n=1 Tax=Vitrella brassicaformis (strain CCMP3155) TaxID=1169540 RepID=A0A0G4FBE7_VITBC|nr:unnamed protein product [Vitrella brassicaformis CCMP3155]|eukprot:CEM09955.1 unnamed protein product [Vitrella brassicaformis CCMP3155]
MGDSSLSEQIVKESAECLNESSSHPLSMIWGEKSQYLESEDDPNLLIKLPFRQPVRITGIRIDADAEDGTAPQTIKIFRDQPSLGFIEAESDTPTEQLALTTEQLGTVRPLRAPRFTNVTQICVFVEDNHGADTTRINKLELLGSVPKDMDMKEWTPKPKEGEQIAPGH